MWDHPDRDTNAGIEELEAAIYITETAQPPSDKSSTKASADANNAEDGPYTPQRARLRKDTAALLAASRRAANPCNRTLQAPPTMLPPQHNSNDVHESPLCPTRRKRRDECAYLYSLKSSVLFLESQLT